jgi:hypothetical protein
MNEPGAERSQWVWFGDGLERPRAKVQAMRK